MLRPCDAVETLECWQLALENRDGPSVLALTRQNLPQLRKAFDAENRCAAGAYEISRPDGKADVVAVRDRLGSRDRGRRAEAARAARRRGARRLGAVVRIVRRRRRGDTPRVIGDARSTSRVEAAVRQGWDAIIGSDGVFVGMTGFGASAPYKDLYRHFGITPEKVAEAALSKLAQVI